MSAELLGARKALRTRVVDVKNCTVGLAQTAVSINRLSSTNIVFTLDRVNYVGAVRFSASGLPAGVTVASVTSNKTSNLATVTLSATNEATLVSNSAFTITATTPFGSQTFNCTLTVNLATAPFVTNVSPSSALAGSSVAITITGSNFLPGSIPTVGGASVTDVVVVNSTTITCTAPSRTAGSYTVSVTTSEGTGSLSNALSYGALPFFEETFAGLQLNPANGFTWNGPKNTSVVTFDGRNCMRFRYQDPGSSSGPSAEQRFNLGRNLTEVWIEYNLHIPSNWEPLNAPNNNKFLALWSNSYSQSNTSQVILEYDCQSKTTSSARSIAIAESNALGIDSGGGDRIGSLSFITAAKRGQWNRIRVHFRQASGTGQTDGLFRVMMGDELIWRSRSDYRWWPVNGAASAFTRNGYFMGSANTDFPEITDFHVDNPRFYDGNPGWVWP